MGKIKDFLDKISPMNLSILQDRKIRLITGTIIIFMLSAIIASIDFLPEQISIQAGQVAETDISAPRTINYIDEEATAELEEEAVEEVETQYSEDTTVVDEVSGDIDDFFILIEETQKELVEEAQQVTDENLTREGLNDYNYLEKLPQEKITEKVEYFKEEVKSDLSDSQIRYILLLRPIDLVAMEEEATAIAISYLNQGIREGNEFETVKAEIERDLLQLNNGEQYNRAIGSIIMSYLRPNMILDEERTEQLKQQARESIEPIQRTIIEGETILRQGSVATAEDIRILEALGLLQPTINYFNILGLILVVLLFFLITIFYILNYQPEVLDDEGVFYLMGLMPIFMLTLAQLAKYLPLEYPSFVIPIAMASIIITILINTDLAVIFTIGLSILVTMVSGGSLIGAGVLIISGLTGIYSVTKLSQRSDLVRAGFIVGATTSLAILGFMLANPSVDFGDTLFNIPFGIINGLLVAILVNGLLPYIENIFGVTSPVKLLELSNPRHPLLKRLLMEAPGTYHHSIIVGNLAEAAADEVGADSLLTRVGAYYHDIGKIKRSYFFTENQIGSENPHDKLSPNLSTLIITSHVKDGVELGKQYKLPQIIIDIIRQHHGTSIVSFFYQEAVYDEKYENVDKDDFRYEGPKPQTKEAVLLMLADIVEAAVRSNAGVQNNPGKLEAFVRKLIKDRLNSGQLDESDLTLKDLDKVAESFISILTGIFHNRVEYPDNVAQELKGAD